MLSTSLKLDDRIRNSAIVSIPNEQKKFYGDIYEKTPKKNKEE